MTVPKSVPELAASIHRLPQLQRIFEIRTSRANCLGTPELLTRYQVPIQNSQEVTFVRNRVTEDVCWYNASRKKKPQQFVRTEKSVQPSTSAPCDFCSPNWQTRTATDLGFGRIEGKHVVTASNLFKYVAPYQAVAFLKDKHDLLDFSLTEFQDYLNVSAQWFRACSAEWSSREDGNDPTLLTPMVLWNGGGKSGASQRHSHMQFLFSATNFPQQAVRDRLMATYDGDYYRDLIDAHHEVCLSHTSPSATASVLCSIVPLKNREMMIIGERGIEDEEFQHLVFCGLRTLIDDLGTSSFNLGIFSGMQTPRDLTKGRIVARIISRGQAGSMTTASDWGGLEVFGAASIAHDDPFIVKEALDRQLTKYIVR